MRCAHMFEHADRHHPVKAFGHAAIVGQADVDPVGQTGISRAFRGQSVLFFGQRHTGHLRLVIARQRNRHAAPATADVQHPHPRRDQKLVGDVLLFLGLRGLQTVFATLEIGAGILPVRIQEEVVKFARKIIMVGHIRARAIHRVELVKPPPEIAQHLGGPGHQAAGRFGAVLDRQRQKPVKVVVPDLKGAVHIALADAHLGAQDQLPGQRRVGEFHANRAYRRVSIKARCSVRQCQFQRTLADQAAQHTIKQHFPHGSTPWTKAVIWPTDRGLERCPGGCRPELGQIFGRKSS